MAFCAVGFVVICVLGAVAVLLRGVAATVETIGVCILTGMVLGLTFAIGRHGIVDQRPQNRYVSLGCAAGLAVGVFLAAICYPGLVVMALVLAIAIGVNIGVTLSVALEWRKKR